MAGRRRVRGRPGRRSPRRRAGAHASYSFCACECVGGWREGGRVACGWMHCSVGFEGGAGRVDAACDDEASKG